MTTIVTRAAKGGRLSFTEMDANLINLQTTADAAAPQITTYTKAEVDASLATKQQVLGFTPVNANTVGINSGIATLDGTGKLTTAQIPTSLVGAVVYQGVWNASTNTPTLSSGVGTKGYYYKVSVAGTTAIDTHASWVLGDTIIYNGTTWDKIDGADVEVLSVAGRTGVVSLTTADISGVFSIENGGTGANTAASALSALGAYAATNPSSYITSSGAPVQSVFGRTGSVVLTSNDVTSAIGFVPASSVSNISLPLVNGAFSSATLTTSAVTAGQLVDSIAITAARSIKYLIQITSGTSYHATEMLVIHDGTTAYTSQSNDVFTTSILASFDSTIVSGNLRLLVTPVNAVTTIKVIRTSVAV